MRETTETPVTTPKELQASAAEMVKDLLESGRKKECWRELIRSQLELTQRHAWHSKVNWKKVLWSEETRIELFGHRAQCLADTKHCTSPPSPLRSTVVATSCCSDASQQQDCKGERVKWMQQNIGEMERKLWCPDVQAWLRILTRSLIVHYIFVIIWHYFVTSIKAIKGKNVKVGWILFIGTIW